MSEELSKELIGSIASVCHEANRVLCERNGDFSQVYWFAAPEWQKQSAISGVEFGLANPDVTPEQQHQHWMDDKIADGWVYGEVKNVVEKTHPCLVPYDELPEFQKRKDIVFRAIVDLLTA